MQQILLFLGPGFLDRQWTEMAWDYAHTGLLT